MSNDKLAPFRNGFKEALQTHQRQVGLWSSLCSQVAAEVIAGAGFDWILIDGEHAPIDTMSLMMLLQAMAVGTAEPVFRVPSNDAVAIKQAMDVGSRSLLIPFVQNADEARAAVAATRYPPLGIRGVSGASRASNFGRVPSYLKNAHLSACVMVQVETREALTHIEAIAAVDGVDGVFIGPSDLAADLGHLGEPMHPEVQGAIDAACQRIKATGKAAGILSIDPEAVERLFNIGFDFIAVGSDLGLLSRTAQQLAARFRAAQPATVK